METKVKGSLSVEQLEASEKDVDQLGDLDVNDIAEINLGEEVGNDGGEDLDFKALTDALDRDLQGDDSNELADLANLEIDPSINKSKEIVHHYAEIKKTVSQTTPLGSVPEKPEQEERDDESEATAEIHSLQKIADGQRKTEERSLVSSVAGSANKMDIGNDLEEAEEMFNYIDHNMDGYVSLPELITEMKRRPGLAERLGVPIVVNEASASAARDRDKLLLWFADADVDGNKKITLEQFQRAIHNNHPRTQAPSKSAQSEPKHNYVNSGEVEDAAQDLVFAVGNAKETVENPRGAERERGRKSRMSVVGIQSDLYSPRKETPKGSMLEPAPQFETVEDKVQDAQGMSFGEGFDDEEDDDGSALDKQIAALQSRVSASVQDAESEIRGKSVTSGSILDAKHDDVIDIDDDDIEEEEDVDPKQVGAELLAEARMDEDLARKSRRKSVLIDLNRLYATALDNSDAGSVLEHLQKKVQEIAEEAEQELEKNLKLRKRKEMLEQRHREELAEYKMRCLRVETQVRLLRKHEKATCVQQQHDMSDTPNAVMVEIERQATKNAITNRPAFSSRIAPDSRRYKYLGKVDIHSASTLSLLARTSDPAPKRMSDTRMKVAPLAARKKLHTLYSPRRKGTKPKYQTGQTAKKPAFHC